MILQILSFLPGRNSFLIILSKTIRKSSSQGPEGPGVGREHSVFESGITVCLGVRKQLASKLGISFTRGRDQMVLDLEGTFFHD